MAANQALWVTNGANVFGLCAIASRRACCSIVGKAALRASFFPPPRANSIRKKLDFEHSDVDRAPVQAVDPLGEIASAETALTQANDAAVLFDSVGSISA